jgi:hypothetical protein
MEKYNYEKIREFFPIQEEKRIVKINRQVAEKHFGNLYI